ncbi:uncharacterized protein [Periplaneta americana]|uniref:uncharacterized protein n=1 Tax=Periplaneta americana TaxID=6978 RepID=UPI0037E954EA
MDTMGKWNNGFYCPGESTEEQFCCGTATFKYCCPQREHVVTEEYSSLPLLLGVIFGVVAAVILVTIVSCCFCSCCIVYKKRQPRINGGPLYRMHCSSTASGVANMYSFSNPNSLATTPLDSAVAGSRLLVDLEPVHSLTSTEGRAAMGRGHTFSRETRSDIHVSELGEVNDQGSCRVSSMRTGLRSPEPPPPYDSSGGFSSRDEQHRDTTVQVLSHGSTFSQHTTFNPSHTSSNIGLRPSPLLCSESHLHPSSRTFTSTASELVTIPRVGTTFNHREPVPAPLAPGGNSAPAQTTLPGVGTILLPGSSSSSGTTASPREHHALYHSTKF